jgi:hypothetical protein
MEALASPSPNRLVVSEPSDAGLIHHRFHQYSRYFFSWIKPKGIMTPSVIDLPDMLPGQKTLFEPMAASNVFVAEGIGKQGSP